MNILSVFFGRIRAYYFGILRLNIIKSGRGGWLWGRVLGGVEFWRGRVIGGGVVGKQGFSWVYFKKYCSKHGFGFGEAAALLRLAVGLPGHSKGGGALRGAGVSGREQGKEVLHGQASINKPRNRVLLVGSCGVVQCGAGLCQLVVDKPKEGQSVFSMPR